MRVSLLSLVLLSAALPAQIRAQDVAERAAVQRVIVAFANNIHTGKLDDNEALFAPTGIHILTDDLALHTWAEYRDQVLLPEISRYHELRYAHTSVEASIRGNIAWAAFRWQISGGGGDPAPVLGRATVILEKIDDRWMIEHLHFSR